MKHIIFYILVVILFSCTNYKQVAPPKPYGIVPSERQLHWHELEMYAFLHFTTNTFTDKEWGFGD
ncbi:MAG: glycoside hydrolase family 29, partial [Bacteroidales bacterium]|nr:glycoside hydrolase family 29 [Bacteroidales bacterium]